MIQILVTDRYLTEVGDPVADWDDLEVAGRFNEPSSGSLTVPATPEHMDQLAPGNRVQVIRDGAELISGPIEKPWGPLEWSADTDGDTNGRVTVHFADDLAPIAGRVTYPNPAAAATAQTTVSHYTASGPAGTLMTGLVNLNAGPGALTVRRVPSLVIGTGAGLGTSTSVTTRFEPLGDVLRSLAIAGGSLGFRTVQTATAIEFRVYQPSDKSGSVGAVRFSRGLGNLRKLTVEREGPTCTAAIVGGQGEGTARAIREVVNSQGAADWWRLEKFIDQRQTAVTAELDAAGTEAITEGAESFKLATVTVDTDDQMYGVHYGLGDKVSVELLPGYEIDEIVRGYTLTASADGKELITAVIGSQEATSDPAWLREARALHRRLSRLEGR